MLDTNYRELEPQSLDCFSFQLSHQFEEDFQARVCNEASEMVPAEQQEKLSIHDGRQTKRKEKTII
ncbi:hypothetical protein HS3_02067 [Bacillus subtilis]|nr:hypothetical protein HS3_02067 [Bacillus subtilis]